MIIFCLYQILFLFSHCFFNAFPVFMHIKELDFSFLTCNGNKLQIKLLSLEDSVMTGITGFTESNPKHKDKHVVIRDL